MTTHRNQIWIALLALSTAAIAGCEKENPAGTLPTVKMQLGDRQFTLEVADNERDRKYGLMRRESMPADHGMIFAFPREAPLAFYMRNTKIPLDIIYVDATGKVVSVKQMKPHDERTVPSDGPAQFAIELNKGMAAKAGVTAGTQLAIPAGVKSKD
ncbi:MAG TPA: DUF192 domain-containing protein [Tepidisphaeraceae bacterium]|nr:DUF192 domain-containing protein [Tepidisphaeraceae bacterium]